jgi:hypothetical protein
MIFGTRETIAGTVYGTIIVMSVLTAGARFYRHELSQLGLVAGGSALILWLAHVYSHGLGESLQRGRRLTRAEFLGIARREISILLAAIPPVVAVELGAVGVLRKTTAFALAIGLGVAALTAQGIRYASLERLSRRATILTVAANLALALAIVALEVAISH